MEMIHILITVAPGRARAMWCHGEMTHPRTALGAVMSVSLLVTPLFPVALASTAAAPGEPATRAMRVASPGNPVVRQVIVISVDGLNPEAITRWGPRGTPTLHRLMSEGISTLEARTEYERTETLPNHTGMVTGLRIRPRNGGHGVDWNDDRRRPRTVHAAAGRTVPSVFKRITRSGRSTALFASKTKFSLWKRSWPRSYSKFVIRTDNAALVRAVRADLYRTRALRFVHLSAPDVEGHRSGYMGAAYLEQVRRTDAQLGTLVADLRAKQPDAVVILTSDHGGLGTSHADATKRVNQRIPFIVWGRSIGRGDLYAQNPAYANPGTARVTYSATRQPVRNGAVANLTLDLLGLPALKGSEHDRRQDLHVG